MLLSKKYQVLCDETAMVGVINLAQQKAIETALTLQKQQAEAWNGQETTEATRGQGDDPHQHLSGLFDKHWG